MTRRRFVTRRVVNGTVKIAHRIFRPSRPYDGRLDGMRLVFCLYWVGDVMLPCIYLWGTEDHFLAPCGPYDSSCDPTCVAGRFPWAFWDEVKREVV